MDDDLVLNLAVDDESSSKGVIGKKGGRWTDRQFPLLLSDNNINFLLVD